MDLLPAYVIRTIFSRDDIIAMYIFMQIHSCSVISYSSKTGQRKVQGVPQSQAAALPRHQEEEETDKTKQAQIEQTYEKH